MSGGIVDSAGASATTIKNAVWNALTSAHTTVGSFGVLLKDELAKFGTLVNTGGTATLGGMIGDTANSSIVARLNAIPTSGGGTTLTNIAVRVSQAASTTTTVAPSAGQHQTFDVYLESAPDELEWLTISANSSNDINIGLGTIGAGYIKARVSDATVLVPVQTIRVNSASDFTATSKSSVGNYIWQRTGIQLS
mgnify:CR=1 FL=1